MGTQTFNFTNGVQTFTAQTGYDYTFTVTGAGGAWGGGGDILQMEEMELS